MEHVKMIATLVGAVVGFFGALFICVLTPFWMAAAAGML